MLPPVGDASRAKRWKAARRQHGKVEEQRARAAANTVTLKPRDGNAAAGAGCQLHKRLKVSDKWMASNVSSLCAVAASTPQASPSGQHAMRQLNGQIETPGGSVRAYAVDVQYSLAADAESESAAKRRDDRHRWREQAALEQLNGAYAKELEATAREVEAEAARIAQEQARLQRKASVARDGYTMYDWESYRLTLCSLACSVLSLYLRSVV